MRLLEAVLLGLALAPAREPERQYERAVEQVAHPDRALHIPLARGGPAIRLGTRDSRRLAVVLRDVRVTVQLAAGARDGELGQRQIALVAGADHAAVLGPQGVDAGDGDDRDEDKAHQHRVDRGRARPFLTRAALTRAPLLPSAPVLVRHGLDSPWPDGAWRAIVRGRGTGPAGAE